MEYMVQPLHFHFNSKKYLYTNLCLFIVLGRTYIWFQTFQSEAQADLSLEPLVCSGLAWFPNSTADTHIFQH